MNIHIQIPLFIIVATLLFSSCISKRKSNNNEYNQTTLETTEESPIIDSPPLHINNIENDSQYENTTKVDARIGEFVKHSDPLNIDTVIIKGNTMFIHVRYGGGCTTHEFEVIGSPMLAKSYPPIRSIQLVHRANNDMCLAMVQNIIEVNVTSLVEKTKEGSEIFFVLDGWTQRIHHRYVTE